MMMKRKNTLSALGSGICPQERLARVDVWRLHCGCPTPVATNHLNYSADLVSEHLAIIIREAPGGPTAPYVQRKSAAQRRLAS